jgi:hypothetical protein
MAISMTKANEGTWRVYNSENEKLVRIQTQSFRHGKEYKITSGGATIESGIASFSEAKRIAYREVKRP